MATNAHLNSRDASRRRGSIKTRLLVSIAAATLVGALLPSTGLAYGWPVKPFDQQHPVRGSFGDPRTVFAGGPTLDSLFHGGGSFSFHEGVDISAPDSTAVYPVADGTVIDVNAQKVVVECSNRVFEYWHIHSAVRVGDHVSTNTTVLGRILRGAGHVHLTEVDGSVVTNPLLPGHLTPYRDTTTPEVASIRFKSTDSGPDLMTGFVRGRVQMIAEAYDTATLPVPGEWNHLPVTPAFVSWHIETLGGKVVVPETIAWDARRTIPSNGTFWNVYARGTYQNMAVFGHHFSWQQPGCYLFRLASFDTTRLSDNVYVIVVTVADIDANHSSRSQRFSVHNRPGVVGP